MQSARFLRVWAFRPHDTQVWQSFPLYWIPMDLLSDHIILILLAYNLVQVDSKSLPRDQACKLSPSGSDFCLFRKMVPVHQPFSLGMWSWRSSVTCSLLPSYHRIANLLNHKVIFHWAGLSLFFSLCLGRGKVKGMQTWGNLLYTQHNA